MAILCWILIIAVAQVMAGIGEQAFTDIWVAKISMTMLMAQIIW